MGVDKVRMWIVGRFLARLGNGEARSGAADQDEYGGHSPPEPAPQAESLEKKRQEHAGTEAAQLIDPTPAAGEQRPRQSAQHHGGGSGDGRLGNQYALFRPLEP